MTMRKPQLGQAIHDFPRLVRNVTEDQLVRDANNWNRGTYSLRI